MSDTSNHQAAQRVECPAAKDPAVRLFIVAAMLVGFGVWCALDRKPVSYWTNGDINKKANYLLNNWGPVLFLPGGLVALVGAISSLRRRLVADEEGIGYAGGKRTRWSDLRRMDAALLEAKGILDLYDADGRRLRLDSWKLTNFKALVAFVEDHLPQDVERKVPPRG